VSNGPALFLVDPRAARVLWFMESHHATATARLSPDGRWIAWQDGEEVWLCDVKARRNRRVAGVSAASALAFDGQSTHLAIGGITGDLYIVDALRDARARLLPRRAPNEEHGFSPVGSALTHVSFSPDGQTLHSIVGVGGQWVHIEDGRPVDDPFLRADPPYSKGLRALPQPVQEVSPISSGEFFPPVGRYSASGRWWVTSSSLGQAIRLVDVEHHATLWTRRLDHTGVEGAFFSSDEARVIVVGTGLSVFETETGRRISTPGVGVEFLRPVSLRTEEERLYVATANDGACTVELDAKTVKCSGLPWYSQEPVLGSASVTFDSFSQTVAAGKRVLAEGVSLAAQGRGGLVALYGETPQGDPAYAPATPTSSAVASSMVAVVSATGGYISTLADVQPRASELFFDPRGERLAIIGSSVEVWSVRNPRKLFEFDVSSREVTAAAFSASGDRLLLANAEGLRWLAVDTGAVVATFSMTGARALATGAGDRVVVACERPETQKKPQGSAGRSSKRSWISAPCGAPTRRESRATTGPWTAPRWPRAEWRHGATSAAARHCTNGRRARPRGTWRRSGAQDDAAQALSLQGRPEAFDDRDAGVAPDGPESRFDPMGVTPRPVGFPKLRPLIGHHVRGRAATSDPCPIEQPHDLFGTGLLEKHSPRHHATRMMVKDSSDPPAEGPNLCQSQSRQPRYPKAPEERDHTQIAGPNMVGPLRRHGALRGALGDKASNRPDRWSCSAGTGALRAERYSLPVHRRADYNHHWPSFNEFLTDFFEL
jgi:hypothetical protein